MRWKEVLDETKKKDLTSQGGWDKAEEYTENDPPDTNYKKNVSARRGFVGS